MASTKMLLLYFSFINYLIVKSSFSRQQPHVLRQKEVQLSKNNLASAERDVFAVVAGAVERAGAFLGEEEATRERVEVREDLDVHMRSH